MLIKDNLEPHLERLKREKPEEKPKKTIGLAADLGSVTWLGSVRNR